MGELEARELKELHTYKMAKIKIEETGLKRLEIMVTGLVEKSCSGRPYCIFTPWPLLTLKYPSQNMVSFSLPQIICVSKKIVFYTGQVV